jgi:two-component system, NarL family, nitrate/nitrite response regulator NarL
MNIAVYSKSESFNSHIIGVGLGDIVTREDLSSLAKAQQDVIIVHEGSFRSDELTSALQSVVSDIGRIAVADEYPDIGKMLRFTNLGVQGYCNAYMAQPHYKQLATMLSEGHSWFPPSLLGQALSLAHSSVNSIKNDEQLPELTVRQKEIALSIARGKSNKEVAIDCGISERTVKSHLTQIFEKLSVKDRLGLAVLLKQKNVLAEHEHID